MRSLSEPFFSLLSKTGRKDIRRAFRLYPKGDLLKEVLHDTWFSMKFRVERKLKHRRCI